MKNAGAFYAMLFRMKHIKRWGLMHNLRQENLAEHALEVSITAHALALIGNEKFGKQYNPERVALRALFHDAAEIFTGDLPTPVKYHSPEMTRIYKDVEAKAGEKLLGMLPEGLAPAYEPLIQKGGDGGEDALIHAADKLCAYIKCMVEVKAGNYEFNEALASLRKIIEDNPCAELKYFYDNYIPYFGKSLDEQGGML